MRLFSIVIKVKIDYKTINLCQVQVSRVSFIPHYLHSNCRRRQEILFTQCLQMTQAVFTDLKVKH